MPLIPRSSKVKIVLIILFFLIVSLSLYFRARDARAPIVANIPSENATSTIMGRMEDGIIFDEASLPPHATTTEEVVATSTATTTASTTIDLVL